jgi:cell division septum initiation protein DivIVA
MESVEDLYKLSFFGYDKGFVDEMIDKKDRLIELQERDMESLKREIQFLKRQINYSKSKKK